jgi:hypothetical protein
MDTEVTLEREFLYEFDVLVNAFLSALNCY